MPSVLIERLQARFQRLPVDFAASLLMIMALVTFTVTGILMRSAAQSLPILQILFLRQLMALVLMAPLFWRHRGQILHPEGLRLHTIRGSAAVVSMVCGNAAVVYIPFADATAIQMSEVLFITALAAMFLGEKVGWRRWSACAVGFLGVVVMIRPFSGAVEIFALVALFGSAFAAISVATLRFGSRLDSAETVIFFQSLIVLACTAPFAWWVWAPVNFGVLAVIAAMAVLFALGNLLFTNAFRIGNASAIVPLQYLRLLMMAAVGFWLYDETPSLATTLGAALIVGAAIYTLHRNSVRGSQVRVPPRPN
ncbi:MAG: DMT family transporter [Proteobacteria bacterium]|nr:DMT family transporter [Pseudomonadota bacterium]